MLGIRENELGPIVEYVGKRFITEDEAKAAKTSLKEAPTSEIEALRETRNDVERALRNGNFMDDEEEAVLRGQLADLNDEIRALEQRGRELITPPARGDFVFDYDDMDNEINYELERLSNAYRGENLQRVAQDTAQIMDQGPPLS